MEIVWFLTAGRYFIFGLRELLHHLQMLDLSKVFVTIYWLFWLFATLAKSEYIWLWQKIRVMLLFFGWDMEVVVGLVAGLLIPNKSKRPVPGNAECGINPVWWLVKYILLG